MLQMIWEFESEQGHPRGGNLWPRLPRDGQRHAFVPDGKRFFTVEQAAEFTGQPVALLERQWKQVFSPLLPVEAIVTAAAPGEIPAAAPAIEPESVGHLAEHAHAAAELPHDIERLTQLDILRVISYPQFSDAEWQRALSMADRRRLDPIVGQVLFLRRFNGESKQHDVVLLLSIESLRLLADRTKTRGAAGPPEPVKENGQIVAMRFTTMKRADGEWVPQVGIAYLDEYRHMAMGEFAETMPKAWLGKCAEAISLRLGWPQECGDLYTPDEMAPVAERWRQREQTRPAQSFGRDGVDEPWVDDAPSIQLGREPRRDPLRESYRRTVVAGRRS